MGIHVHVYACIYVCLHVYAYVCMYVGVHLCICMYARMYVGVHLCICMYARMYLYTLVGMRGTPSVRGRVRNMLFKALSVSCVLREALTQHVGA